VHVDNRGVYGQSCPESSWLELVSDKAHGYSVKHLWLPDQTSWANQNPKSNLNLCHWRSEPLYFVLLSTEHLRTSTIETPRDSTSTILTHCLASSTHTPLINGPDFKSKSASFRRTPYLPCRNLDLYLVKLKKHNTAQVMSNSKVLVPLQLDYSKGFQVWVLKTNWLWYPSASVIFIARDGQGFHNVAGCI
jgi:hypothetical protein